MSKEKLVKKYLGPLVVTSSILFSGQVLADDIYKNCKYVEDRRCIEYTVNSKRSCASVSDVIERFGKPLSVSCNEKYTVMVLKKAIVRVAGGKRVIESNDSSIYDEKSGNFKVADFLEYSGMFGPETAINAVIGFDRVAVVITKEGTLYVYKGLQSDNVISIQTTLQSDLISKDVKIEISGDENSTTVILRKDKVVRKLVVTGTRKGEIKIREED